MNEYVSELKNVQKDYPMGDVSYRALHGVSLSLGKGEFATLVGSSGSGKSTMLHIIGGIDMPTAGSAFINKFNTQSLSDKKLSDLRKNSIGFIFQAFNLIEVLNVYENIEYPMSISNANTDLIKERVSYLMEKVGLTDYQHHKVTSLSGGQRQRVAIARALVNSPGLVLADEPTASLDTKTSREILDLMKDMCETEKVTFLFATHDPEVMSYAKRAIQITDGRIVSDEIVKRRNK